MPRETTHVLYEWEPTVEVEIMGQLRHYPGEYHSLIVHRLDDLPSFPQIPTTALKTPVWYSGYLEAWYLANGQPLQLPYKLR